MKRLIPILFMPLVACADFTNDTYNLDAPETSLLESAILRVDVLPSSQSDDALLQAQSVMADSSTDWQIELSPTLLVTGQVIGQIVTPWAGSDLPGQKGPIEGVQVMFSRQNAIEGGFAITNDNGEFSLELVWDSEPYTLSVIPEDTKTPFYSQTIFQDDYSLADLGVIDLGAGEALYGQVTVESEPVAGTVVYAINEHGVESARTKTNSIGFYHIRVPSSGSYEIVTEGLTPRDPTLTSSPIFVEENDARHDVELQPTTYGLVSGRIQDGSENPHDQLTIRFTSTQLQGYTATEAKVQLDVRPSSGLFDVQLPPGRYSVDFVASDSSSQSSTSRLNLDVSAGFIDMGTITLPDLQVIETVALDANGQPVPNAIVNCVEDGYGERLWTGITDANGLTPLSLPQNAVQCEVIPPTNIPTLARTRIQISSPSEAKEMTVLAGENLYGIVRFPTLDAGTEEYILQELPEAILEFRNDNGQLLASTTSNQQGDFSARIAVDQSNQSE